MNFEQHLAWLRGRPGSTNPYPRVKREPTVPLVDEEVFRRGSRASVQPTQPGLKRERSDLDDGNVPRARLKLERRECSICCEEVAVNRFPKLPHTGARKHARGVCFRCWDKHLVSQVESKGWKDVSCPEYSQVLDEPEVRKLAKRSTYAEYLDKAAKSCRQDDEEYFPCPSADCDWACFLTKADGNIFTCQKCNYRFCIDCEVTMHEDEICEQYQARKKKEAEQREAENELSLEMVKKVSKQCPGCKAPLDKYTGCDHVTCSRYRYEFCWLCFADYSGPTGIHRVGNSAHKEDCPSFSSNLPSFDQDDYDSDV